MNFVAVNSVQALLNPKSSQDPQSSQGPQSPLEAGSEAQRSTHGEAQGEAHGEAMWAGLPTYFRHAAEPLRQWLQSPDVIEIVCNRPQEVWVEARGINGMTRHAVPELSQRAIENLAQRVAGNTNQNVNAQTPLLSAAMPGGERFQAVLSPVAYDGGAFAIRKQVIKDMDLDQYMELGGLDRVKVSGERPIPGRQSTSSGLVVPEPTAFENMSFANVHVSGSPHAGYEELSDIEAELVEGLRDTSPEGIRNWLRFAVQNRTTMIIAGGTGSGKTTFCNGLLKEIPASERIISLEDTRELEPPQKNYLALVASRGGQGRASTTIQDCLEACLRLRPDRILMGEVRGAEAYSYLRAVNTGHPGSMTTLHADNPRGAYEALAFMVMQAGLGLSKSELIEYVRFAVPVVVQIGWDKQTGRRGVTEIYYNKFRSLV